MIDNKQQYITLITGASKGIGRACADLLAERRHHVVGLARHQPDDFPGDFYCVDLRDRQALENTLETLSAQYAFSGLINNAGIAGPELIEDINLDTVDAVFQVNLVAAD